MPTLRDFPWLSLPVVIVGVAVTASGLWRAFSRPETYRGKIWGSVGLTFSLLLSLLFGSYVFVISYWLPEPTSAAVGLSFAPDVALSDQRGRATRLADYAGRKVVLVFYRGYW